MAIVPLGAAQRARQQAAAGYLSPMPTVKVKAPPSAAPKISLAGVNPSVGYGGGGWSYPLAATGVKATYAPTGATYTGVPPTGVPFSGGAPAAPGGGDGGGGGGGGGSATPYLDELQSDPLYQDAARNYQSQTDAGRLALTQA